MARRLSNRREALDELAVRADCERGAVGSRPDPHDRRRRPPPPRAAQSVVGKLVKTLKAIANVYLNPLRDSRFVVARAARGTRPC